MKRIILFISILFGTLNLFAQTQSDSTSVLINSLEKQSKEIEILHAKISSQEKIIREQSSSINKMSKNYIALILKADTISERIEKNKKDIGTISTNLGTKIQQTEVIAKDGISKLDKDITQNYFYWIIGTLVTLLLGGIVCWMLGKRIQTSKIDVETQIKNTKKTLEKESIKLDSKLVEVLETQLKLNQGKKLVAPTSLSNEIDHSLALKVADEIVRMQKNISKMDDDIKGLKPLIKGIERIQANFASNGYEMVNLLNKDYDERMTIDVINFITDENMTEGKKVITAVIKPQVNYNGVLIQRAQVDVSQN